MYRRLFIKLASLAPFLPAFATTGFAASGEPLPVLKVGKVEVYWQEADLLAFKPRMRKVLQQVLPGLSGLDESRFRFAFFNELKGNSVEGSSVFDADTRNVLLVFHRDHGSPRDVAEALTKGCPVLLFEYDYDLPVEEASTTFELYYGGQRYRGEYVPQGGATLIEAVRVLPVDDHGAGGLG